MLQGLWGTAASFNRPANADSGSMLLSEMFTTPSCTPALRDLSSNKGWTVEVKRSDTGLSTMPAVYICLGCWQSECAQNAQCLLISSMRMGLRQYWKCIHRGTCAPL
jgi:hypothetical protein